MRDRDSCDVHDRGCLDGNPPNLPGPRSSPTRGSCRCCIQVLLTWGPRVKFPLKFQDLPAKIACFWTLDMKVINFLRDFLLVVARPTTPIKRILYILASIVLVFTYLTIAGRVWEAQGGKKQQKNHGEAGVLTVFCPPKMSRHTFWSDSRRSIVDFFPPKHEQMQNAECRWRFSVENNSDFCTMILLVVQKSQGQPPGMVLKPCECWDQLPTSTGFLAKLLVAINSIAVETAADQP